MKNTLFQNCDQLIVQFEFTPRALAAGPGGLNAAIHLLGDQFTDLLLIDETSMQIFKVSLASVWLGVSGDRGTVRRDHWGLRPY